MLKSWLKPFLLLLQKTAQLRKHHFSGNLRQVEYLLVAIVLAAPFVTPSLTVSADDIIAPPTQAYTLDHNDVLSISVFDSPEFKQDKLRVQPDGNLSVAPFGNISVRGLTTNELKKLLTEKYRYYLNTPIVTVTLEETHPIVIYVSGAVINPGSFEFNTDLSKGFSNLPDPRQAVVQRRTPILSNVLIAAGGVRHNADIEHVVIKNTVTGNELTVNVLDLITQGNSHQDIKLVSGDSVSIPFLNSPLSVDPEKYAKYAGASISPQTIPVKVYGYVRSPGIVQLEAARSRNLNSAISQAGGYLEATAYGPKQVFLSRVDENGSLVTRQVEPFKEDVALFPNDVIYVPRKKITKVGMAFDYLGRLISPAASFSAAYNNWALMFDPQRFNVFNNN